MSDLDLTFDAPDFIESSRRRTVGTAIDSLPDDPQVAARAYELGRATGEKPALVYTDVEGFEANHKVALTSSILTSNAWLREYVEADQMRAKLSADDWGALDEVTSTLEKFRQYSGFPMRTAGSALEKGIEGFRKGFGEGPIGHWVTTVPPIKDNLAAQAIWAASGSPLEAVFRTLSGGIHGATDAVHSLVKDMTGSDQLARDIAGMTEMQLTGTGVHGAGGAIASTAKYADALARAKLWIDSGLEPPRGLHPEIDKIKEKQNALDVERLEDATKASESSVTRERDPTSFADLIRLRDKGSIEIDGEAVARLYGDKPPNAEDGLLGWVPRIGEQLELSRSSGGDISIPIADWLAHADGDMMKLLRDDIRVRPGGITKNEAKAARGADGDEINAERDQATADMAAKANEAVVEGEASAADQSRAGVRAAGEAKAVATDPRVEEFLKAKRTAEIIPDDLPSARAAAGLEPLFSIGDRKLKLERREGKRKPTGDTIPADEWRLIDESGNKVGWVEVVPYDGGKRLYVDNIGAFETQGYGPNAFGNSLTRDIARQLKEQYPQAEMIGGFRISGARRRAGSEREVWIKFDENGPKGWGEVGGMENLRELFNGAWKEIDRGIEAYIKPFEGKEKDIARAVEEEAARILPKNVTVEVVAGLRREGQSANAPGISGMYSQFTKQLPRIIASLDTPYGDTVGVLRHEAIHHLRNYGFFNQKEWLTLERAAREQDWFGKYLIEERYQKLDQGKKTEEAIADGYRRWAEGQEVPQAAATVFQKLKDFFERIRDRIKEILGRDFTWEEIFQKVHEGEIKSREGTEPLDARAYRESRDRYKGDSGRNVAGDLELALRDAGMKRGDASYHSIEGRDYKTGLWTQIPLAELEGLDKAKLAAIKRTFKTEQRGNSLWIRTREYGKDNNLGIDKYSVEDEGAKPPSLFRTPGTIGMTERQASLYARRIREMQESDIAYETGKAEREAKKRLTAEWKTEKKNVSAEVEADFNARPDVAADLYFARGELFGEKVERLKIDPADLKAMEIDAKALPKDYVAKPDGASIELDDLASLVGYPTGKAMVTDLIRYNEAKLAANMSAKAFRDRLVSMEVERRMTERFGDLEENIRDAAMDQVAGETSLNLLAEETLALGIRANREAPLNKAEIREWLKERFEESPMAGESSEKYLRASGKAGTAAEIGLLKEKFDEAYRAKQQQYYAVSLMREARVLEKEQKSFAKTVKRLGKREVKGLDQEFHDWIGMLLWQANVPSRRSPLEIQRSQQITGAEAFPEFVDRIIGDGWAPEVGAEILAGRVKPMEQMTVGEFHDFKDAIDSLNYIGRQVEKINIAGEKRDFAEFRAEVVDRITTRPQRSRESQEKGIAHRIFQADAEVTRIENWLKELDLGEEMGPLVNTVIRPMAEAKHKEYSLQEQLSKDIKALPSDKAWKRTLNETIPNDWFIDPSTGEPFKLTRSDLLNLMLNHGNRSNVRKLARGYGTPDPTRSATRAEADAFQSRMKDYIDEHATAQDWAYVQGIWDIYKGFQKDMEVVWRNTSGTQPKLLDPVTVDTPHGTFEGGYYPLLRDWYLSGTPKEKASRTLFGPDYPNYSTPQGHLKERTGASYFVDFRQPHGNIPLRMQQVMHDIAYRDAVMAAQKVISDKGIMAAIRQHYGSEYEKQLRPWLERIAHGATMDETNLNFRDKVLRQTRMNLVNYALPFNYVVTLTPDIGAAKPSVLVNYFRDREANLALANKWSKEIPHAIYNMDRDFREAMERAVGQGKVESAKAQAVRWGYGIVSSVSREFRTATWLDKFQKATREGHDEAKSAAIADSYVREQHGSAALADLPPIMAGGEAGRLLTMFYGYWNTQLNWLRTVKGDVQRKEYMKAVETAYGTIIIGSIFGAAIANPAKEEDNALHRIVKAVPMQLLGMIPYGVRETGTYFVEGVPPSTPLGSLIKSVGATKTDIVKYFKREPIDKGVRHTAATLGMAFGVPGALQFGRTGQGVYDAATGRQRPRDIFEWTRLMATGEARLKRQGER